MPANDTQVGGSHYKVGNKPEHWDLVITYNWDYFQSQITKYLMRWKDKYDSPAKRLEDLKKARHFLDKYIENFEQFDRKGMEPKQAPELTSLQVFEMQHPQFLHDAKFLCEGGAGDGRNLYTCRRCRMTLWAHGLEEAARSHMCNADGASATLMTALEPPSVGQGTPWPPKPPQDTPLY